MKTVYITIISEIENDLQTWTFPIDENDLYEIGEKYGHLGCSLRGNLDAILYDINQTWGGSEA